jgi:hypothetical protein
LDKCFKQCHGSYFEFGCGGSTFRACLHPNIEHITSIDSSIGWIKKVSDNSVVSLLKKQGKINFLFVDINADEFSWGIPKDKSKINNWPEYSFSIRKTPVKYDMILIDGRFRVACGLHSLEMLSPNGIMVIHDYTNRTHYHILTKYYDMVETVETLAVFKKKPNYDIMSVQSIIDKYEMIYD